MFQRAKRYKAFGEEKTIREWSKDPRCKVSYQTLLGRLSHQQAEDVEKAITTPIHDSKEAKAFGETKTIIEWSKDPRCKVTYQCLLERIQGGMDPEEAISSPSRKDGIRIKAFGETRTISEWTKDPRCKVTRETLYQRLKRGIAPEEAIASEKKEP